MLKFVEGDIFKANVEAIVNPVNTVGVMGKGLALQFKKRFPENFRLYREVCEKGLLEAGEIFIVDGEKNENGQTVYNVCTKNDWRDPSQYDFIYDCLSMIAEAMFANDIQSIAIPAIGCGEGGLEWSKVKDMIVECFTVDYDREFKNVEIFVYEPR